MTFTRDYTDRKTSRVKQEQIKVYNDEPFFNLNTSSKICIYWYEKS